MSLPRFFEARLDLPAPRLDDVEAAARAAVTAVAGGLRPGARVAVTAGSRGISHIAAITGAVVAELDRRGARPFIVPAMGSHGGGTAEGQTEVLAGYGISEQTMGVPLRSSMEVERLGESDSGCPAHVDRISLSADAVVVLNRVKPHTILRGEQGSGLVKMLSIGLGKHVGAQTIHNLGLDRHVAPVARALIERAPVLGGIGIIENGLGETAHIEPVAPADFIPRDREMLATARAYLPHVPIEPLDVLVVRRMGKNISGTGIDPNIVGMHRRLGGEADRQIETIVALDLTEESHGNAIGVGMADLITTRLRDKIDWMATSVNALTSHFVPGIKLPFALPSDREALETAVSQYDSVTVRMAVIDDTLHMTRVWLSESLINEARARPNLTLLTSPAGLPFAADGALAPGW